MALVALISVGGQRNSYRAESRYITDIEQALLYPSINTPDKMKKDCNRSRRILKKIVVVGLIESRP